MDRGFTGLGIGLNDPHRLDTARATAGAVASFASSQCRRPNEIERQKKKKKNDSLGPRKSATICTSLVPFRPGRPASCHAGCDRIRVDRRAQSSSRSLA